MNTGFKQDYAANGENPFDEEKSTTRVVMEGEDGMEEDKGSETAEESG